MDTPRERKTDQRSIRRFALAGGVAFLAVVSAYAIRFYREGISNNPEDWSRFGEYIGGVAGTLLALFTLVVLAAQLVDTRKELQRQSASIAKQNFESTFFRLIDLLDRRTSRLGQTQNVDARAYIAGLVTDLTRRFEHQARNQPGGALSLARVVELYRGWHAAHTQVFDWYFRLLYQIMSAIDQAAVPNKQAYADILWATVGPAEKHLLFHHALTQLIPGATPLTSGDFGTLVKRYDMAGAFDPTQITPIPADRLAWYNDIPD